MLKEHKVIVTRTIRSEITVMAETPLEAARFAAKVEVGEESTIFIVSYADGNGLPTSGIFNERQLKEMEEAAEE